jgi:hypothetical protein
VAPRDTPLRARLDPVFERIVDASALVRPLLHGAGMRSRVELHAATRYDRQRNRMSIRAASRRALRRVTWRHGPPADDPTAALRADRQSAAVSWVCCRPAGLIGRRSAGGVGGGQHGGAVLVAAFVVAGRAGDVGVGVG